MLTQYHFQMMHLALDDVFSPPALKKIIRANLSQDGVSGQIGHDEFHFDNNSFEKSYAYIEEQRARTISSLMGHNARAAWAAFGRLTHTAQDFYAHSNYIDLWLNRQPGDRTPPPADVDPIDPHLLYTDTLRSGKIYILDALTFIPLLKPLVMPFLPRDAHGWMNLDSPGRGPNFTYAFHAAVKRTRIEFERTTENLPGELLQLFVDKEHAESVDASKPN